MLSYYYWTEYQCKSIVIYHLFLSVMEIQIVFDYTVNLKKYTTSNILYSIFIVFFDTFKTTLHPTVFILQESEHFVT